MGLRASVVRPVEVGETETTWHYHLRVPVVMCLEDGTQNNITALVDTGSEVNLIRRGLVENHYTTDCGPKVKFWAVNQQSLGGNHRRLGCQLVLQGTEVDTRVRVRVRVTLLFPLKGYDATIDTDMISSYEWLALQDMVVYPKRHGLTIEKNGETYWVGGVRKGVEVKRGPPTVCQVNPLVARVAQKGGKTATPRRVTRSHMC